jgi:hypothetical protein
MKIFCLSIYNKNYDKLKNLNLIPVGLGKEKYDKRWKNDRFGINISKKNVNFGEYTFHYNIWKNNHFNLNKEKWIGFCSYRRFWVKKNSYYQVNSFNDLKKNILLKEDKNWKNFDVILGEPIILNKIKNIKMIKKNFFEVLKKPKVLFTRTSIRNQFDIFHGSFFLKKSLQLLNAKDKSDFLEYLNGYELNPYNMFICKNNDILNHYYDVIFPWLFKCEKIFQKFKLESYEKKRIYAFLAERFMPYWFKKNYKVIEYPIAFFNL